MALEKKILHDNNTRCGKYQLKKKKVTANWSTHDQSWICGILELSLKRGIKMERKVKLNAEVEFSAQGYDTHLLTSRQGLTVGVHYSLQDSLLGLQNTRLGCMQTHTIKRIYNLWIPLTVWTHNSNSDYLTFLKTHFALVQSTMQNNSSLSRTQHLFMYSKWAGSEQDVQ